MYFSYVKLENLTQHIMTPIQYDANPTHPVWYLNTNLRFGLG